MIKWVRDAQLLIPQEDLGGMLSLIQAIVPPPRREVVSINLDIDLYKENTNEFISDEKIWGFLEVLRDRKKRHILRVQLLTKREEISLIPFIR